MNIDRRIMPAWAVIVIAAAVTFDPAVATAAKCAEQAVEARGEPSRFAWLAKTKTRANWRRKVRTVPGLGPDYANWARAQNTEERCLSGPSGTLCVFTGTPCLP